MGHVSDQFRWAHSLKPVKYLTGSFVDLRPPVGTMTFGHMEASTRRTRWTVDCLQSGIFSAENRPIEANISHLNVHAVKSEFFLSYFKKPILAGAGGGRLFISFSKIFHPAWSRIATHMHAYISYLINSLKYMEQCVKGYMVPPDHRLFHSCPKHSGGL